MGKNQYYTEGVKRYPFLHKGVFIYGVKSGHQGRYKVLICSDLNIDVSVFLEHLENAFCQNLYYRQARQLNQFSPLEIYFLQENFGGVLLNFYKKQKHIRDGDVKLPLIYPPMMLFELLGF